MCTLAFCHKRKLTEEEFFNCEYMNGDGIGFGFNKNKKQFFVKGFMNGEDAWDFYKKVPGNKAHVVHFRLGTAGLKVAELTHPFICSETSPLLTKGLTEEPLLFHNGVILAWRELAKKEGVAIHDYMSDTRLLAIMAGKYGINNFKHLISKHDGKFIILKDGKAKLFGNFISEHGVFFSNDYYKFNLRNKNMGYDIYDEYYFYKPYKSYKPYGSYGFKKDTDIKTIGTKDLLNKVN